MERHAEALVTLLESCLNHNLKPSQKEEDPPHAKISSDIISCMFLVSIQMNRIYIFFYLLIYFNLLIFLLMIKIHKYDFK